MTRTFALVTLLAVSACGGDSGPNGCSASQVEVAYLGGGSDGKTVCQPIPAACGATAACAVQACIAAMYSLCAQPYIGVGCSDTAPPTIISCNP
jgi:hypothetical protein